MSTRMPTDDLVGALAGDFAGELIDRTHPAYDGARRVWNGLIDRRPALVARCTGTADVIAAVRLAAERRPPVSVRAGGHQVAGGAVCDDGLVIDLSAMKGVQVDPIARTARVRAGVTWAELDRETQVHGLVVPGGEEPRTGVAGVSLGGGLGLLTRAYGLSCDNIRSIEIVTADGNVRVARRGRHEDLLWAARGCGRGLGVVTALEFALHPLGPRVATVQVYYPRERAEAVMRAWREVVATLPDTVTPQLILRDLPPLPQAPPELHGTRVVAVGAVYAGPPEDSGAALDPLRRLDRPLTDVSRVMPYTQPIRSEPRPSRAYMKSHFLDELTDEAIRAMLDRDASRTGPDTAIAVRALGGAVTRVGPDHAAYPHRNARFNLNVHATWHDPAVDHDIIEWCRSTWTALRPHANGGVYLNFAGLPDETTREEVYGASAARLGDVRARHDPAGVFATAALQV